MKQAQLLYLRTMIVFMFGTAIMFYGLFVTDLHIPDVSSQNLLTKTDASWFKPKTKVIILLVDALRYDYFHYDESIVGKEQYPYQNKFAKTHNIFKTNPENSVIIKTYSDSPTWTPLRVRCIGTGNIPPYMQLMQSLRAPRAIEDSIFKELKKAGKKGYATGDPVWQEIFEGDIIDEYRSESFDLRDADSDKMVSNTILNAIERNNFDLLVGHRLGVDHMGHWYNSDLEPRIGDHLTLNDDLVAQIINSMDNSTVLLIMGDHGMGKDGWHGGSTKEETSTVIAAYCKNGFQKYKSSGLDQVMKSIDEKTTSLTQVDITPTLAMLLGVPIPFSNLGQMINDLYPNTQKEPTSTSSNEDSSSMSFKAQILRDNYLNTLQIHNYLVTFQSKTHGLEEEDMASPYKLFQEIQAEYDQVNGMDHQTPEFQEQTLTLILKMQSFSDKAYHLIKTTSGYNSILANTGILILLLAFLSYLPMIQRIHSCQSDSEAFTESQSWSLKSFLVTVISDKFLHAVILSAVAIYVALTPKIIELSSGVVLILMMRTVYYMSVAAFYPNKEASANNVINAHHLFQDVDQAKVQDKSPSGQESLHCKKIVSIFMVSPLQTLLALAFTATSIVCFHVYPTVERLEVSNTNYVKPNAALVLMFTLIYLVCKCLHRRAYQIIALALIVGIYEFVDIEPTHLPYLQIHLALFLFGLFVLSRVRNLHHTYRRLSIGWLHLIIFCALYAYYTFEDRESEWVLLILPRIVFGLLLATSLAGCILSRGTAVQNLQLCLIELLFLVQDSTIIFTFSVLLSVLRLTNFAFKKYKFQSIAYPIIIAALSYIGFYMLDHSDRSVSKINFRPAFIGLNGFNIYVSPVLVLLNVLSIFILGMTFVVNYLQNTSVKQNGLILQVDEVDAIRQVNQRNSSNGQADQEQGYSIKQLNESGSTNSQSNNEGNVVETFNSINQDQLSLLKIRNNLLFLLFISAVFIAAALRCYLGRNGFAFLSATSERFIMSGAIYISMMFIAVPAIF